MDNTDRAKTVQKPCSHGLQNKKAMKSFDFTAFSGAMEGTRTPGLLIRSQSLYPTELLAHTHFFQMPEYNTTSLRKKQVLFSLFPTFLSSPPRRLDSAGASGVKCSPEGDTGYG